MDDEQIETIKWKLTELANSDPENVEGNEYEILGEDEQGRDGYCTVKITDVAEQALALISHLQKHGK